MDTYLCQFVSGHGHKHGSQVMELWVSNDSQLTFSFNTINLILASCYFRYFSSFKIGKYTYCMYILMDAVL